MGLAGAHFFHHHQDHSLASAKNGTATASPLRADELLLTPPVMFVVYIAVGILSIATLGNFFFSTFKHFSVF